MNSIEAHTVQYSKRTILDVPLLKQSHHVVESFTSTSTNLLLLSLREATHTLQTVASVFFSFYKNINVTHELVHNTLLNFPSLVPQLLQSGDQQPTTMANLLYFATLQLRLRGEHALLAGSRHCRYLRLKFGDCAISISGF